MAELVPRAAHGPGIEVGGDDRPFAGAEEDLELDAAPGLVVHLHDPFPVALLVVEGRDVGIAGHEFLGARVPEHPGQGRIGHDPGTVRRGLENAQGRVLEDGAVFLLGRAQVVLGLLAVGNVVDDADDARVLAQGVGVGGLVQHGGTHGPVAVGDLGFVGIHAPVEQGGEARVEAAGLEGPQMLVRIPGQAEPVPEGAVDARDGPAALGEIDGQRQGVHEGAQKGQLVLDADLDLLALPDVDDQDDQHRGQDEQTDDDGPELVPVDGIERGRAVDHDAVGGQQLLVDAQLHEHPVVELGRLLGAGDDRNRSRGLPVQHAQPHFGHGAAVGVPADHLSAHQAVAEQELPGPVQGHARGAPDDFQQVLGRIHGLAHILVKGDEKENAVLGRGLDLADQLVQGEVVQKLDLHVHGQLGHAGADLVGDGQAGQALVADDHQALLAGMKAHGHGDVVQDIELLQDAGHAVAHGHGLRGHVVDPAEHDGHAGKELGPVLIDEIVGVVVGDDDEVEIRVAELVLVIVEKNPRQPLLLVPFRVHVLYLEIDVPAAVLERLAEAIEYVVGPGIAVVVRVEVQDVDLLLDFRAGGSQEKQDEKNGGYASHKISMPGRQRRGPVPARRGRARLLTSLR